MQREKYLEYTTQVLAAGLLSKSRQASDDNLLSLIPSLLPIVWLSLTENEDLTQVELKLLVVEGRNVPSLDMKPRALAF